MTTPRGVAARLHDAARGPSVSFELYPPRSAAGMAALPGTLERLAAAGPDFFSVTYGASGSTRDTSRSVVRWILEHTDVDVVAHLTCIGAPRDEVRAVAGQFLDDGVRDVLALRGDPPAGVPDWEPHPGGLRRASELVALLRELAEERGVPLSIGVAATPSRLPCGAAVCPDIHALAAKQAAGADYAVTQVFFEVESYVRYRDAARAAGVTLPLLPGLVPLTDPRRLRRLEQISGVPVPAAVLERLDAADEDERHRVGTAMGAELVRAVLDAGAPGVHVYTFNTDGPALDLLRGAGLRDAAPTTVVP